MGSVVSSRLDYINKNPESQTSFGEIEHEIDHLKKREQVSGIVALASTILLMIGIAGVLGGGHIIIGALAAIALFASVYNYFCRQAESSLRGKQVAPAEPPKEEAPATSPVPAPKTLPVEKPKILGFFSR